MAIPTVSQTTRRCTTVCTARPLPTYSIYLRANKFKHIPRFLLFLNPHPVGFDLASAQRHYRVGGVQSVALGIPPQSITHG